MKKTKAELKRTVQVALEYEYGFKPSLANIKILNSNWNGTYIILKVGNRKYTFKSYIMSAAYGHGIWCGDGTITKREQ